MAISDLTHPNLSQCVFEQRRPVAASKTDFTFTPFTAKGELELWAPSVATPTMLSITKSEKVRETREQVSRSERILALSRQRAQEWHDLSNEEVGTRLLAVLERIREDAIGRGVALDDDFPDQNKE